MDTVAAEFDLSRDVVEDTSAESRPEYFVDRSLGRLTAEHLRADGWGPRLIADHYPDDAQTVSDPEWIAEVCRRGWPLFTKDKAIQHRADAWLRSHRVLRSGTRPRGITKSRSLGRPAARDSERVLEDRFERSAPVARKAASRLDRQSRIVGGATWKRRRAGGVVPDGDLEEENGNDVVDDAGRRARGTGRT